jgi:hypothetical protein
LEKEFKDRHREDLRGAGLLKECKEKAHSSEPSVVVHTCNPGYLGD